MLIIAYHSNLVKDRAKIGQVHGDLILSFEEILAPTLRGRYDMDVFLRLRGKTYNYKFVYPDFSESYYQRTTSRLYSS